MDWTSIGNGIVASASLCGLAAVCVFALRALGRKSAAFLGAFAVLSVAATIQAQKTNGVFKTGLTRLTGLSGENNLPVYTTSDDIARGWRVESVTTNATDSYAMPTNGTPVGNWHVHGARSSFGNNRIDFGGFAFPLGASLAVSPSNLSRLTRISGPDLPLAPVAVPPGTQVTYSVVYEGAEASDAADDIAVAASLVENETFITRSNTGVATAIKAELTALNPAPANTNLHRHVYGVLEEFQYRNYPEDIHAAWSFFEGDEEHMPFAQGRMILPAMTNHCSSGLCEFVVTANDACYTNHYRFVLPEVSARNPRCNEDIRPVRGEAGWLLLHIALYIEPAFVSFKGMQMREIPDESGNCPHSGYYNDTAKGGLLSHSAAAGAGVVNEVRADGYWTTDRCGVAAGYETPWSDGWKEWPIPIGWGYGSRILGRYGTPPTTQKFTLWADGTFAIKKFGIEAKRDILNNITIQGVQQEK